MTSFGKRKIQQGIEAEAVLMAGGTSRCVGRVLAVGKIWRIGYDDVGRGIGKVIYVCMYRMKS